MKTLTRPRAERSLFVRVCPCPPSTKWGSFESAWHAPFDGHGGVLDTRPNTQKCAMWLSQNATTARRDTEFLITQPRTIVVGHHTAADHHVLLMVVEVARWRCSAKVGTAAAVACARAP